MARERQKCLSRPRKQPLDSVPLELNNSRVAASPKAVSLYLNGKTQKNFSLGIEPITSANAFSSKIAADREVSRRSPTLPSPTLFPGRAVTQGDALDQSRESLLWSRSRSRKYGTRVVRFHPGPEHKKDIRTSGTRRLEGLISTGPLSAQSRNGWLATVHLRYPAWSICGYWLAKIRSYALPSGSY